MNALEIKNLTKSYPDFTLDNLNLTLPSGCIMGLVGENGAGKSTTIKLILDMIHKDSGTPLWTLNTKRNSPSLPLKSLFWKRLSRAMRSTKRTLTVLSL